MIIIKKKPWIFTILMVVAAIIIGSNYSLLSLQAQAVESANTQMEIGNTFEEESTVFGTKLQNYLKIVNKYMPEKNKTKQEIEVVTRGFSERPGDFKNVSLLDGDNFFKKVETFNQNEAFASASQQEKKYMQTIVEEIKNFEYIFINNPYQAEAKEFNQAIGKFPARVLKYLTTVRELPEF